MDQNMLSCLWLAQKSHQHVLTARKRRWMFATEHGDKLSGRASGSSQRLLLESVGGLLILDLIPLFLNVLGRSSVVVCYKVRCGYL